MSSKEEVYTVLLNSGEGTGAATSSQTYFINWEYLLPPDDRDYLLTSYFTAYHSTYSPMYLQVEASGLKPKIWDSRVSGQSEFIALAYPAFDAAEGTQYIFDNSSNLLSLLINKPTQNAVTISLYDYNRAAVAPAEWNLVLQLTPISKIYSETI